MTTLAPRPSPTAGEGPDTCVLEQWRPPRGPDLACLVLSDDPELVAAVDAAVTRRCFRVDDYQEVEEAALEALLRPPALAVIDLRLACAVSQFDQFAAFCRQLITERASQVAVIGCANDEQEEMLFRQEGVTYYFPGMPTAEQMEHLAAGATSRVQIPRRHAPVELLLRSFNRMALRLSDCRN